MFGGATALCLFLLLSFGCEREGRGRLGFPLQTLVFFRLPLLAHALNGFEPHALFLVRQLGGGFGFSQHPLAVGGFFRGPALLLLLQPLQVRLPGPVGGRARLVHQPLALGRIGRFAAPAFLIELVPLHFAGPFRGHARFRHQPLALACFFGLAAQALFLVALPLRLVRALRGGLGLPQQLLTLAGPFSLETILFLLQPDALLLEGTFGRRLGFTRRALCGRSLFEFTAAARFLRSAGLGFFRPALRLFGLLLIPCPFLFRLVAEACLFGFGGLSQARLFLFGTFLGGSSCLSLGRKQRCGRDRLLILLDL